MDPVMMMMMMITLTSKRAERAARRQQIRECHSFMLLLLLCSVDSRQWENRQDADILLLEEHRQTDVPGENAADEAVV